MCGLRPPVRSFLSAFPLPPAPALLNAPPPKHWPAHRSLSTHHTTRRAAPTVDRRGASCREGKGGKEEGASVGCVCVCECTNWGRRSVPQAGGGGSTWPEARRQVRAALALSSLPISPGPPAWQTRHACVGRACARWDEKLWGNGAHNEENETARREWGAAAPCSPPLTLTLPATPPKARSTFFAFHPSANTVLFTHF